MYVHIGHGDGAPRAMATSSKRISPERTSRHNERQASAHNGVAFVRVKGAEATMGRDDM